MSGIAGAIDNRRKVSRELLERMAESMRYHPGARVDLWNDGGTALCRLHHEITNRTPQPVFNAERTRCLVLFGELFTGGDDAEYALRLYEERGRAAFGELDGSFCLALVDLISRETLLVSDRFSSRPLYYTVTPQGALLFATQVSSILRSPEVSREHHERSVLELFHFQRVFGTKTLNRAISVLPPGSVLSFRDSTASIEAYFEMRYRPEPGSERRYVEEMAHVMRHAADRVTGDGHRMGVLLSAGLDSRMVLAAATGDLACYQFNDTKNHEWFKAERLAAARGFELRYIQRDPDHYLNLYDESIEIGGGMYQFNYAHAIGFFEGLRGDCDFMLHGYAPELYFRGTNVPHVDRMFLGKRYRKAIDWTLTAESVREKMLTKLKYSLRAKNPAQLFLAPYASRLDEAARQSIGEQVEEAARHSDDPYDQFLWPDTFYHSKFPSFVFENSIRSFIGERSMVFFNDVLDLHLRMPVKLRADSRVWVRAVRELHSGVAAVADANTGYSPFLPWQMVAGLDTALWIGRKLRVIPTPPRDPGHATISWPRFQEIIRHHAKLQELIRSTVNDPGCLDPEMFDIRRLNEMMDEHLTQGVDHRHLLFLAITFGGWNKKYGPGTRAEPLRD